MPISDWSVSGHCLLIPLHYCHFEVGSTWDHTYKTFSEGLLRFFCKQYLVHVIWHRLTKIIIYALALKLYGSLKKNHMSDDSDFVTKIFSKSA